MTLHLKLTLERWPLREPFEIARAVMHELPLLHLVLSDAQGTRGQAEAAGVDYDGETPQSMAAQIDAIAAQLHDTLSVDGLQQLLPRGGARNALDCALWDLRAKQSRQPVWQCAAMPAPQACLTAVTIGLGSADELRRRAREAAALPLIKLKLDATRHIDCVRLVRSELPRARLIVDANQAWTIELLRSLLPELSALGVELIEQPLPRGHDAALAGLVSPIPIAADESCTERASLPGLIGRYQAVNIKLDKCGGLTEALALAREARALGLDIMVGCMCGTSLGMAPAMLLAPWARWLDLDGPLLQRSDRKYPMHYDQGRVSPPDPALWG